MNVDQIIKQVDWLDDERRKDQTRISSIEETLVALEGRLSSANAQIKDQGSEINRLTALIGRMDSYDQDLFKLRKETKQSIEEIEKSLRKREEEALKLRQAEIRNLDTSIEEIRQEVNSLLELRRAMSARAEEDLRLGRLIDELRQKIESVGRSQEEYNRTIKLLDDGRRQDAKRLTDLHGEVAAIRKRGDDQHGRIELNSANQKKIEARLNEFSIMEIERRESMQKFLENQALRLVEQERVWKEWQTRFNIIENQSTELEKHLETLETSRHDILRTQKSVEDLSQKVERRISEITEVQRLAEERFRQEWVTFKADDQKRWTNYTLTVDEQRSATTRQLEKILERITHIEDELQDVQDLLTQATEQTEKRLQSLLSNLHDWVTEHERTIGRVR